MGVRRVMNIQSANEVDRRKEFIHVEVLFSFNGGQAALSIVLFSVIMK